MTPGAWPRPELAAELGCLIAPDMISDYISLNRTLRSIVMRCHDAHGDIDGYNTGVISGYLKRDLRDLHRDWPPDLDRSKLQVLASRLAAANPEYFDITDTVIPEIEEQVDGYFEGQRSTDIESVVLDLLHPAIVASSYGQFRAGRYRDAVFNGVLAVFELIRQRTGLTTDGTELVDTAYGGRAPRLKVCDVETRTGESDQSGFHHLLRGVVLSVRNPKAHSLVNDLSTPQAAQYLAFLSILARRIEESEPAS